MFKQIQESSIVVLFGSTGDLAKKKLFPALYELFLRDSLPEKVAVLAIGRKSFTRSSYVSYITSQTSSEIKTYDPNVLQRFQEHVYYHQMDILDQNQYLGLSQIIESISSFYQGIENRIFYLAVAPSYFDPIINYLGIHKLTKPSTGYSRLVIEKPFGTNLKSAKKTNKWITKIFGEENTYRIDHYLGKEMLQNILMLRFYNVFFEAVLNNTYIDQIQISILESEGIKNRASYYDNAGAIRDMVQSHVLQLLSLITMDAPTSLTADAIHHQKAKLLRKLRKIPLSSIEESIVLGQYETSSQGVSYREEAQVAEESKTDTYVAMKLFLDSKRFKGVPIYIRTGKRLHKKSSEIVIVFKKQMNQSKYAIPNELIFKIQPEEGVVIKFNNKIPGSIDHIMPVEMNFCQNCTIPMNSKEAYEHLLYNVLRGDRTLFTRWDEVSYSWKFIDDVMKKITKQRLPIHPYPAGSYGPNKANLMLEKDNRFWLEVGEFQ